MYRTDIPLLTLLTAFIGILVQGFYLKRIWLSKHWVTAHTLYIPHNIIWPVYTVSKGNKLLTAGIALLILGQFSITMAFFAITYPLKTLPQLLSLINFSRAMNTTVGSVEITIGGVMIYLLHTSRSGSEHTNNAINIMIFYTAASGLLTGLDAIIASILSFALPHTLYYLLFCGIGATCLSTSTIL